MKFVIYARFNHNSTHLKNGKFFDNLMKDSHLAKKLGIETYRNLKSASLKASNKRRGVL